MLIDNDLTPAENKIIRAFLREKGHTLKYSGGMASGYEWSCTCGATNFMPWDNAFDRTWEAYDHLRDIHRDLIAQSFTSILNKKEN